MSAALATAALPNDPDPPPDPVGGTVPAPSRTGRLLGLLRKLIDYGTELAYSLQNRTTATALFTVALQFGTRDIALILARVTRGLRLANALEARLVSRPERQDAVPAAVRGPASRKPRAAPSAAPRVSLALVPTAEEIAAALRHRSAAVVIADICRDLGIVPSHPLWGEVMMILTETGGSVVRLVQNALDRVCAWSTEPSALHQDGWPAPWQQAAMACGTGPP